MKRNKNLRPHIGIFGRRNYGKSSLINALTAQDIAIVSAMPGTTTDPVKKSIEIPGVGPSVLIDTAGIDDSGELGEKRIAKTRDVVSIIDLAILVMADNTVGVFEEQLVAHFNEFSVPFFIVHNKSDVQPLRSDFAFDMQQRFGTDVVSFSALGTPNTDELTSYIQKHMPETAFKLRTMFGGIVKPGDTVLLITPIDTEAPEGRMILPQMQALRDVLDNDCICVILTEQHMEDYVKKMSPKPVLAVCDSQVFGKTAAAIPSDILLTSFSIVLARQKGDFDNYIKGTPHISNLKDGDKVLILESCTHHVTCDDIGRHKIPRWLTNFTGKQLSYEVVAGLGSLPGLITDYALVVQCGGCMITQKQLSGRLRPAVNAGVPVTNYGMAIAYVHGIFDRAVAPFLKNIE